MRTLHYIASITVVIWATVGCLQPEPPPEPFQTGQYGPGLETDLPGDKLEVLGPDDERLFALRVSDSALRIYNADQVRLGTAAIREGQARITRRSGEEICTVAEEGRDRTIIICGDTPVANARQIDGASWVVEGEDGHGFRIDVTGDTIRLIQLDESLLGTFEHKRRSFDLKLDSLAVAGRLTGDVKRPAKELAMLLGASLTASDNWTIERQIGWLSAAWLATKGAPERQAPVDEAQDATNGPTGSTESEEQPSSRDDQSVQEPAADDVDDNATEVGN